MSVSFDFDFEKALAAVLYIASRTDGSVTALDKYKTSKLLFLAEKYHLVRHGRPIFGDTYKALPYGPIPQNMLDLLSAVLERESILPDGSRARTLADSLEVDRHFSYPRIRARVQPDLDVFSTSDVMALDHVIATYGRTGFHELKAITHGMVTYMRAWENRPPNSSAAVMAFEDFFEEEPDAVQGILDEVLEDDRLRKALAGGECV